jgi:TRAP-type C4-dicarboxylate transport system substrate-binding protein
MKQLTISNRQDNSKAIETLKQNGMTVTTPPSAQAAASYEEVGKQARQMLVGKLYSQDLLNEVEKALAEYRTSRKSAK